MIRYTEKQITLNVLPFKPAGASCVVVGWDVPGVDPWVLNALAHGAPMYTNTHVDMSCVLYAVYESVKAKLLGGAYESVKNKIYRVDFAVQGSEFLVIITCNANAAVVKKAISAILKNASPGRMYLKYVNAMRRIDVKPDKAAFYYCVDALNDSLARAIRIVLTGKVSIPAAKTQELLKIVAAKLDIAESNGKGERRTIAQTPLDSPYASVNSGTGLGSVMYKKYLDDHLRHDLVMTGGKIYVPVGQSKKIPELDQRERIEAFVDKFMKFGNDAHAALIYLAARDGLLSTAALVSEGGKVVKRDTLVGYISALLKHL